MIHSVLNLTGRQPLPVIRQSENAECGLAVMAMVAGYHGLQIDLSTLRRRFQIGQQGITFRGLVEIATRLDLDARAVSVPMEQIHQLVMPAILHWDLNHFVVLRSVSADRIVIHDPARGKLTLTHAEVSEHFTGIALEITPTTQFQRRDERVRLRLGDLWGRMINLKRSLLQIFVLSLIMQMFLLASPFLLQLTVDEVLTKYDADLMVVLAIGFAGFALINCASQAIRGYSLLHFGSTLSYQMAGNLFRHLIRLPIEFYERRHIGDISSRVSSLDPIKTMLTEGLIASLIDGIMAISTLTLMLAYSAKLAGIALAAWLLYFFIRIAFYRPLRSAEENQILAKARETTVFVESIRGATSIKLLGGESQRERLWIGRYADVINARARREKLNIWFASANTGIFSLENVLLVFVAANMVLANEFTVGMIFAFMAYKQSFTEKASALVEKAIDFRMLNLHLERVADIAHSQKEDLGVSLFTHAEQPPISGALRVEDLHYRYSRTAPEMLKGVNLEVAPGEMVAIVGPSGCGKTTLVKVLCGLFEQDSGEVSVDGQPMRQYGLAAYRRQIGVVMQNDDLFAGSIAENIAFFDPRIDMDMVARAAQAACIDAEVQKLPMKYETILGDMGSLLSGGQKQRVMLARALYRQPRILFMDEGTAHLDVATELEVNRSVKALGMTRIIIAHRPETIRMADRILELSGGTLREIRRPVTPVPEGLAEPAGQP
jgi:ATP-binding cassette subfamily B protein RaxB